MKSLHIFTILMITLLTSGFRVKDVHESYMNIAQTDSVLIQKHKSICEQLVRSALIERRGYKWLEEFCKIGPRLSGSTQSLQAIQWAEMKMKEIGFDTVWLQPVMVPHWERGTTEEAIIVNSKINNGFSLNILTLGGSVATPPEGITAEVIELRNFEELEKSAADVYGKIVFFNRELDQGQLNTFAGYGGAINQRVYGAIEAAQYGAIAVLIRSVTTKYDNVPHTGVVAYRDTITKIPAAAIGQVDADFLSSLIKAEVNLKVQLKLDCRILPDKLSYNVIGDVRGTKNPDEFILVSGHVDSWDVGDGAHDDAAGCIQSIEVIDLLKRNKINLSKTLRCVLFINEENGSRGSIEYARYTDSLNINHIAAIESDRGAYTPVGFTIENNEEAISNMQKWLPLLELSSIDWIRKGGSGADISRLKKTKALIGYIPDDQRYMDIHHSPSDVFEEVHPREFELGVSAMAILCYLISEEDF
ncbi:MAG: M28 family peptidase [Ignavibacteriales bacterium]|nr:MAG: M28 family peptidase [Ignavibacteriales bacterium]